MNDKNINPLNKDDENMNSVKAENGVEVKEDAESCAKDAKTTVKPKAKLARDIVDWVETFAVALCAVVLLFTFVFRVVTVDGQSMMNTLHHGERLVISDMLYTPEIGDVVIISVPEHYGDNPLVKRVIATGGQTVDIDFEKWVVTVDGKPVATDGNGNPTNEPYVNYIPGANMLTGKHHLNPISYPYTVPEGHVFVMGDNRNFSSDSRYFGAVDERYIIGKVYFRVTPFNRIGGIEAVRPSWMQED